MPRFAVFHIPAAVSFAAIVLTTINLLTRRSRKWVVSYNQLVKGNGADARASTAVELQSADDPDFELSLIGDGPCRHAVPIGVMRRLDVLL